MRWTNPCAFLDHLEHFSRYCTIAGCLAVDLGSRHYGFGIPGGRLNG